MYWPLFNTYVRKTNWNVIRVFRSVRLCIQIKKMTPKFFKISKIYWPLSHYLPVQRHVKDYTTGQSLHKCYQIRKIVMYKSVSERKCNHTNILMKSTWRCPSMLRNLKCVCSSCLELAFKKNHTCTTKNSVYRGRETLQSWDGARYHGYALISCAIDWKPIGINLEAQFVTSSQQLGTAGQRLSYVRTYGLPHILTMLCLLCMYACPIMHYSWTSTPQSLSIFEHIWARVLNGNTCSTPISFAFPISCMSHVPPQVMGPCFIPNPLF